MDDRAIDREFAEDVRAGLSADPKYLLSRYFYDAQGDELFQRIMASDEYYLTRCELEILSTQGRDIARAIAAGEFIELVELGSGDGSKVHHIIDALHALDLPFVYRPVDISRNSLELLRDELCPGRPWLDLQPVNANYMEWLSQLKPGKVHRVFAFLGSNLGNFRGQAAVAFLSSIRAAMGADDALLIGLDLKKDPQVIEAAYDDAEGHTREFNLNLLRRINAELDGHFDLERFSHRPVYEPDTGAALSFLRSEGEQHVTIEALDQAFHFDDGEEIFMEVSQKYDQPMIDELAAAAGYRVADVFLDERGWFTDQVWRPL